MMCWFLHENEEKTWWCLYWSSLNFFSALVKHYFDFCIYEATLQGCLSNIKVGGNTNILLKTWMKKANKRNSWVSFILIYRISEPKTKNYLNLLDPLKMCLASFRIKAPSLSLSRALRKWTESKEDMSFLLSPCRFLK